MGSKQTNERKPKAEGSPGGRVQVHLPLWKKAVFSALLLAAFFTTAEFILFLLGVTPLVGDEDPLAGFSSQIPVYQERAGDSQPVQMVTARNKLRFFNQQQFAKRKDEGVTRVFCLGGSTTYGRPYNDSTSFCGWLREFLPHADPSRRWEVINAGGISYASYRVAAVMRELSAYQPDIFIVYCGHNEFLEHRTYSDVIDTPAPVRGVTAQLSRTRVYSAMVRVTRGQPEPIAHSEQTAEEFADEVDAILDQSVGLEAYERDEKLREHVLGQYRVNMSQMVDIARSSGADVVLITPASNWRDCSPFKSQHGGDIAPEQQEHFAELLQRARFSYEAGNFSSALDDLDKALAIDELYAQTHHLRGRVLDGLGQHAEAKAAYQRALDEDVCPLRALSPIADIVADIAHEQNVPLVDFAALVEEQSTDGIPGEDLFLDHVHPTIDGHRMLALATIDELDQQNLLRVADGWNDATIDRVTSEVLADVDPRAQGVAMRNLSKVYAWAGKKEEAYRAAHKAVELYPGDAEAHYQVGNLAYRLGKTDEAVERLRFLVSFELSPDVTFYVKAHTQLARMLAERGEYDECEAVLARLLRIDPENAAAQQQWGELLMLQGSRLLNDGRPADAAEKLRQLTRLQPEKTDGKVQLATPLIRTNDYQAGAPVMRSIIDEQPGFLAAYDNLSFVLAQLGQLDEAEEVCRQALEIDPSHDAAQRNLQIILRRRGSASP